ncbi:MAG: hypothetical protein PHF63_00555 [Herbinix sp.]|nr:hypothetical protein [Herbinix sp.]
MQLLDDGITHLNVYSKARTSMGRMLSNFYYYPFTCEDGYFASVECYWHWLSIKDPVAKEQVRCMSGNNARAFARMIHKTEEKEIIPDFRRKILYAIWIKLINNKHLIDKELLKLPFTHYYLFGGKVVEPNDNHEWFIDGLKIMCNHIIDNNL